MWCVVAGVVTNTGMINMTQNWVVCKLPLAFFCEVRMNNSIKYFKEIPEKIFDSVAFPKHNWFLFLSWPISDSNMLSWEFLETSRKTNFQNTCEWLPCNMFLSKLFSEDAEFYILLERLFISYHTLSIIYRWVKGFEVVKLPPSLKSSLIVLKAWTLK